MLVVDPILVFSEEQSWHLRSEVEYVGSRRPWRKKKELETKRKKRRQNGWDSVAWASLSFWQSIVRRFGCNCQTEQNLL